MKTWYKQLIFETRLSPSTILLKSANKLHNWQKRGNIGRCSVSNICSLVFGHCWALKRLCHFISHVQECQGWKYILLEGWLIFCLNFPALISGHLKSFKNWFFEVWWKKLLYNINFSPGKNIFQVIPSSSLKP